jgi:hypothetical protein
MPNEKIRLTAVPFISALVLASCAAAASYKLPPGAQHATLYMTSSTDTERAGSHRFDSTIYRGVCEPIGAGPSLGAAFGPDGFQRLGEALIPADGELTLSLIHSEAHADNSRWTCNVTFQFAPVAGHTYWAHLATTQSGSSCDLKVVDKANVAVVEPDFACDPTGVAKYRNHQPGVLEFRAR